MTRHEEKRTLPIDLVDLSKETADRYGVKSIVSPADFMFWFMVEHLPVTRAVAVENYFLHGAQSADHLRELLKCYRGEGPVDILEFACGYGCVTRFLQQKIVHATVTSCDIHPEAVAFVHCEFGVETIQSTSVPEDFKSTKSYDVVFVLSLFSHLPKKTWTRWLKSVVAPARRHGLVIFTTHGMKSAANFQHPSLDADGFWFHPVSEQGDLDTSEYGSTITSFDFVYRQISALGNARLLNFQEGYWRGNQDVYVLAKLD